MPFTFEKTSLPGVVLIIPQVFGDERGFFIETYKQTDFVAAGITEQFVQDNHSSSVRGVLRGLHFQQHPHAQGKLVRCIRGSIFDVAVDVRKGSPTFGRWTGVELSSGNHRMLYVPQGFAHGFVTLSDVAEVMYKCTAEYRPESDRGVLWSDPEIRIDWPVKDPVLSAKDAVLPLLKDADNDLPDIRDIHAQQTPCQPVKHNA
ncbi:MAG: dTDP-4-dehydrorhamnose 3,5-epimerase [Thermodesulfovibrionales bacterium]